MGSCCNCGGQFLKVARLISNRNVQRTALPFISQRFFSGQYESAAQQAEYEEVTTLFSDVKLKVRGSDEAVLDSYTQFVQRAATVLNLDVSGKIVIPMHVEKRTLLKSPHVYKTHRYQYELRTHARMLQVKQITGDTADIFLEYVQRNIPEGVSMSIESTELESIPEYISRSDS